MCPAIGAATQICCRSLRIDHHPFMRTVPRESATASSERSAAADEANVVKFDIGDRVGQPQDPEKLTDFRKIDVQMAGSIESPSNSSDHTTCARAVPHTSKNTTRLNTAVLRYAVFTCDIREPQPHLQSQCHPNSKFWRSTSTSGVLSGDRSRRPM